MNKRQRTLEARTYNKFKANKTWKINQNSNIRMKKGDIQNEDK